jgi:hypothetical protein
MNHAFMNHTFMNYTSASIRGRVSWTGVAAWTLAVACVACSAPVIKQYQKDGVQFSYYSNWKIVKDAPVDAKPDIRAIQIEGPSHAVISLICEPPGARQSLAQFAEAVASRRGAAIEARLSVGGVQTAQVSKGTSNAIADTVAGQSREGVLQEFSVDLLGQQVPHQARFYLVEGAKYRIMIMAQVATSYATETRAGSDLILKTLAIEAAR